MPSRGACNGFCGAEGEVFFGVRDRKTVPIFNELVVGPFNIKQGPAFPLKASYNLSCTPCRSWGLCAKLKDCNNNAQK